MIVIAVNEPTTATEHNRQQDTGTPPGAKNNHLSATNINKHCPPDESVLKDIASNLDKNHRFEASLLEQLARVLSKQVSGSFIRRQSAQEILDRLSHHCHSYTFQLLNVTGSVIVYKMGKTQVCITELVAVPQIAIAEQRELSQGRRARTSRELARTRKA